VTPSEDVAALLPEETAQKIEPFHAIAFQEADAGIVTDDQLIPSEDVAALRLPESAQKIEPFQTMAVQF